MQGIGRAVKHLALVALLLRAMIPMGWMPDAQGRITICSLDATLGQIHHDGVHGHDGSGQSSSHEECPFAAAPHLASAPEAVHFAFPAVHEATAITDSHRAVLIAARFTPQSPRAPPQAA